MTVTDHSSRDARQPDRKPAGEIEIVRVTTDFDRAQAAVVLGEQRAFAESLLGRDLAEVQPSAQYEYSFLGDFYGLPNGQLLLARVAGEPVGVIGVRRLDVLAA
jgi:hypothetical protein